MLVNYVCCSDTADQCKGKKVKGELLELTELLNTRRGEHFVLVIVGITVRS
jgi:hypothetical protein